MSAALMIRSCGPAVTIQDRGRVGYRAFGLSRGGAADLWALDEAEALFGHPTGAVLEMAGMGGVFEVTTPVRIALTGADFGARIAGPPVAWNGCHDLAPGALLEIGAGHGFAYLAVAGGIDTAVILGARSAHLACNIGAPLGAGERLPIGADPGGEAGFAITPRPRFSGGVARMVPGPQTELFTDAQIAALEAAPLHRDPRSNRMGVRLNGGPDALRGHAGLTVLSDMITPGDIQITGDGTPYVLAVECQTTGGYPRIGSVVPSDLAMLMQAPPEAAISLRMVTRDEGLALEDTARAARAALRKSRRRLVRDPKDVRDLLSYNLIGGVTAGDELQSEGQP